MYIKKDLDMKYNNEKVFFGASHALNLDRKAKFYEMIKQNFSKNAVSGLRHLEKTSWLELIHTYLCYENAFPIGAVKETNLNDHMFFVDYETEASELKEIYDLDEIFNRATDFKEIWTNSDSLVTAGKVNGLRFSSLNYPELSNHKVLAIESSHANASKITSDIMYRLEGIKGYEFLSIKLFPVKTEGNNAVLDYMKSFSKKIVPEAIENSTLNYVKEINRILLSLSNKAKNYQL